MGGVAGQSHPVAPSRTESNRFGAGAKAILGRRGSDRPTVMEMVLVPVGQPAGYVRPRQRQSRRVKPSEGEFRKARGGMPGLVPSGRPARGDARPTATALEAWFWEFHWGLVLGASAMVAASLTQSNHLPTQFCGGNPGHVATSCRHPGSIPWIGPTSPRLLISQGVALGWYGCGALPLSGHRVAASQGGSNQLEGRWG